MENFLAWDSALRKSIVRRIVAVILFSYLLSANAQEDSSAHWNGVWMIEDTLFSIAVRVENDTLKVQAVESLGFIWSAKNGKIEGRQASIEVEFSGATGTVQAELKDSNTAIVIVTNCLPDFMMACLLSKDRKAVFRKVKKD